MHVLLSAHESPEAIEPIVGLVARLWAVGAAAEGYGAPVTTGVTPKGVWR